MAYLLVFLKYPSEGAVKTRLASTIGPRRATALYRRWIGLVLGRVQSIRGRARVVGYYDGGTKEDFATWGALADEWWPQPPGDLGDRLSRGFEAAHTRGGPVIAIGTDCLDLDAPLLRAALEALESHEAVFGPALDGGYYLVGTSRHLPGFFGGIPWSTSSTLAVHLSLCARNAWSVGLLPARRDIDTVEDWLEHCHGGDEER